MSQKFTGKVEILDTKSNVIITLDGMSGDVSMGGSGQDGDFFINAKDGKETIRLSGDGSRLQLKVKEGKDTIHLNGEQGHIFVTDNGKGGMFALPTNTTCWIEGSKGVIRLMTCRGKETVKLEGENGTIRLRTWDGKETICIDGKSGNIALGGNGVDGDIFVKDKDGKITISMDGGTGNLSLGGNGQDGDLLIKSGDGKETIHLDGDYCKLRLKTKDGNEVISLDGIYGNISIGGNGQDGDILLKNSNGSNTIHLDGQAGDIILENADCAEDFDISENEQIEPGSVVVLNQEGKLEQNFEAYDKKVAGVISGAGDYRPGVVLDKKPDRNNRKPVAMVGKVYCKVDAQFSPIEVGDLLTTSPTPGHAMKASDSCKAFGAVLGKALKPFQTGKGLIPILVALQ
ncbi:hypothetical protein JXJ21_15735 [candidate division KSB1 bacterium]|nr:hypothetical protein [candidate division KSB1 bacterium]